MEREDLSSLEAPLALPPAAAMPDALPLAVTGRRARKSWAQDLG